VRRAPLTPTDAPIPDREKFNRKGPTLVLLRKKKPIGCRTKYSCCRRFAHDSETVVFSCACCYVTWPHNALGKKCRIIDGIPTILLIHETLDEYVWKVNRSAPKESPFGYKCTGPKKCPVSSASSFPWAEGFWNRSIVLHGASPTIRG
jgi:hypothetical protein